MACLFGPEWGDFCRYHSRFYAKRDGRHFSRLCVADKLSTTMEPAWLYLPRVRLTGEIREYMAHVQQGREGAKYATMNIPAETEQAWFEGVRSYLRKWVAEHKDGREDRWTPAMPGRSALNESGVWK